MDLSVAGTIIGFILTALGAILTITQTRKMQKMIAGIIIALAGLAIIFLIAFSKPAKEMSSDSMAAASAEYDDNAASQPDMSTGNDRPESQPDMSTGNDNSNKVVDASNSHQESADPDIGAADKIGEGADPEESEPDVVSLSDIAWIEDEKIYTDASATTMREKTWNDCIRFGSSNINADGNAYIRAVCDQEYSRFTAEISPQEGFDTSETVTLYIYGEGSNLEYIPFDEFEITYDTKPFVVDYDISDLDYLYLVKTGEYSQARIAGQFINGYSGMGVLMRDAVLYRKEAED